MNKKEIINQICNLSKLIFDDNEYIRIKKYLLIEDINGLRLFVTKKLEFIEVLMTLDPTNSILAMQFNNCNKLEDVVIDYYLQNA